MILAALLGAAAAQPEPGANPLTLLGVRTTEGAAAGYVPDLTCRRCHPVKYDSYQQVGMARSFRRAGEASPIEAFGREFYHAASQRYYRIERDGDQLVFHRYQRDDQGEPINEFEVPIAWVLGSGNRARSYLYQTPAGELFQVALGWYSETRTWGMSPGFEDEGHLGVLRRVKLECMFCHNAFPEVPAGSDLRWKQDTFPTDLPQGTGCQRCHGPGADHIRAVLSGADLQTIHGNIVNPRKLPPEQRDSVCFQCHMLPAVAIVGPRRFDRPVYSFRPGELLSDYLVHVDIDEEGIERTDRFEINHHGYRFWQSRCYRESKGELACISCHDPHVKPESTAFRAEVAGICRDCHRDWSERHDATTAAGESACVTCHMPTRRTRDVILVTMTDHRIARGPFDLQALVEPITRTEPIITDVELLPFGKPPQGDEGELYRLSATLRAYPLRGAMQAMQRVLARSPHPSIVPYLDLVEAQLKAHANEDAEQTSRAILERQPDLLQAHGWLGLAQLAQGDVNAAMASLTRSIEVHPSAAAHFNLALAALRLNRGITAERHLDAALALRPNMFQAWKYKGRLNAAWGNLERAREALIRALEIEPGDPSSYAELVDVLTRMGRTAEAQRYLTVGRRVARDPQVLDPPNAE